MNSFTFPFGEPLKKVEQLDRTPKNIFVLGVYASAVHAKWLNPDGKTVCNALAVASEPEIFWRGQNQEEIISAIKIPERAGKLVVPASQFNGPSGIALDNRFLRPLGASRREAWLCDLLPYSRRNDAQEKALNLHYTPEFREKYGLPTASIPKFSKKELDSGERRKEILAELQDSKAETLVLLGDLPIKHFLYHLTPEKPDSLSWFGTSQDSYGVPHEMKIGRSVYKVIALAHPRQAAKLGRSNKKWGDLHENWCNNQIRNLR